MDRVFNSSFGFWNGLSVEQVSPDEYLPMVRISSIWAEIVESKIKQLEQIYGEHSELPAFRDSLSMAYGISYYLTNAMPHHFFYVCRDATKREQGIVHIFVDHDCVRVEHLMTHPHNIRSIVNEGELYKAKGVGTALITRVEELALITFEKNRIELYSTHTGNKFYDNLGYPIENLQCGIRRCKTLEMLMEQIQKNLQ